MASNLADWLTSRIYRVTKPFKAYLKVGCADSNTFAGRSMILRNVWIHVELPVGAHVHASAGQVYVWHHDLFLVAELALSSKGAFEKNYGGRGDTVWPLDCLEEIPKEQARAWKRADDDLRLTMEAASAMPTVGENIIVPWEQVRVLRAEKALFGKPL
jgi:hypothetical protein